MVAIDLKAIQAPKAGGHCVIVSQVKGEKEISYIPGSASYYVL